MKKYEDILNETTKYNVTWEVDFDNKYVTVDNVVMAKDEKEAEKVSEKLLDKYLEKRNDFEGFELDDIKEYDTVFHSAKLNGFYEYKPA